MQNYRAVRDSGSANVTPCRIHGASICLGGSLNAYSVLLLPHMANTQRGS